MTPRLLILLSTILLTMSCQRVVVQMATPPTTTTINKGVASQMYQTKAARRIRIGALGVNESGATGTDEQVSHN